MKLPWQGRTGLAKAAVILVTTLTISLGLCGLDFGAVMLSNASGRQIWPWAMTPFMVTVWLENAGVVISVIGLIVVGIVDIVVRIRSRLRRDHPGDL